MNNDQMTFTAVAPNATFQSTSAMLGSGSAYASNPTLNAEGMAIYTEQPVSSDYASRGPRRIVTPGNSGTQQPIGDAVCPLMLMALAWAGIVYLRRRRRQTTIR